MIKFGCSHCPQILQVKDELAGQKVKCPKCGAVTAVPFPASTSVANTPSPGKVSAGIPGRAMPGEETTPTPQPAHASRPPSTDGIHSSNCETREQGSPTPFVPLSKARLDFLAPAQAPGELGRLGPYRVLKVLGAGGMGIVFQAEDLHLQRLVALKVMNPALAGSAAAKARFLREARTAAALKHEHIVYINQVGEDRGVPFLAMEFLEGEALEERLKREGQLPLPEVLRIGREIAEGLDAAHQQGLIHRDIKPANIWLEGTRGRVKILDFGLARSAQGEDRLTQTGSILGTPAYMAPEQASGKPLDARCDLFSLGCVLYQMLTVTKPFPGNDTLAILSSIALHQPKSPHQIDPNIPEELSELVMRLLEKEREARPASAAAVVRSLETMREKWGAEDRTDRSGKQPSRVVAAAAARPSPGGLPRLLLVTAIVGGGLGALLILAVGLWVVWPKSTPARSVAVARTELPLPVPLAKDPPPQPEPPKDKAGPQEVDPASEEWQPFAPKGEGFSVTMPGRPKLQKSVQEIRSKKVDLFTYLLEYRFNEAYAVAHFDIPSFELLPVEEIEKYLDTCKTGILANLADGQLLGEEKITLGAHRGRELRFATKNGRLLMRVRIYVVGLRVYQAMVIGTKEKIDTPSAERFFRSFRASSS